MDNLVKTENNELRAMVNMDEEQATVDGRELHDFLNVSTRYNDWFARMCEYGFIEGQDFYSKMSKNSNGGRPSIEHALTIDMAKELCMIQRNEKGKMARRYFIEVEKAWNDPVLVMGRALKLSEKKLADAQRSIAIMQPKAEFYDAVADSKTLTSVGNVAKLLNVKGLGRNNMYKALRNISVLDSDNVPYQRYVDAGYFKLVESKFTAGENTVVATTTYVTQRGIDYIRKLIKEGRLLA
jgi:anti-repressor protein